MWLAVIHNSTVTSGEWIRSWKRDARAATNHIYVFHEVMNGCKNLKVHYRFIIGLL